MANEDACAHAPSCACPEGQCNGPFDNSVCRRRADAPAPLDDVMEQLRHMQTLPPCPDCGGDGKQPDPSDEACPTCFGSGHGDIDEAIGWAQRRDANDAYNNHLRAGGAFE